MNGIIRYIMLTASRDKLYFGLFSLFLATTAVSLFIGSTSLVEENQMSLALMAGSNRIILMVGLILFISFHIHHTFERREIDLLISRPVSRSSFVVASAVGFTLISLLLIIPILLLMLVTTSPNVFGLLCWTASIAAEAILVANFSLLSALIMPSAVSAVLTSLSFYVISRMMALFVSTIQVPVSLEALSNRWEGVFDIVLTAVSIFIPRLDLYTQSGWLVYGVEHLSELWIIPTQFIVFFPIILLMAVYDVRHKEF